MKRFTVVLILIFLVSSLSAQNKAFYKTKEKDGKSRTVFTMDYSNVKKPESIEEFKTHYHHSPITQDKTGTCWCFSTVSFLESEIKRLQDKEVKLSEMYIVYWEYVEKVRRFVREKGESNIGQGSEHNAAIERMRQYGLVRASDYSGLLGDNDKHNHSALFREIKSYLNYIEKNEIWDEELVIEYIKLLLNKHLGKPPATILVDGKKITPLDFMKNELKLNPDDYVCFISMMYAPFYTKAEFKVPDNWWHSEDYHNVPLEEFYNSIYRAVKDGFTVALGGDVSEIGKIGEEDAAIIPDFDIPSKYINQYAREFRFKNKTSQDDHAIHLVGYKKMAKHMWFLIKDSARSSRYGKFKGYYMFRDDYIKLKILNFLVHRDAVQDLLAKFEK